ncbi:secondary thiamine-phosphate synthase [Marinicauda salina]|uniref:Secondary thiamine-phosphate synthase n=1 Tax=Marinicauda salina TaxID=2135793 RepID=A0A2U2BSF0_9PROT|nr:secondary thiamine-phosphate synthase enzyme YjbQ [Marinicauda salina]PWE16922.1 secondary thiamine-phosphate synthase [Marinicauda salina]
MTAQARIRVQTSGPGLYEFTAEAADFVRAAAAGEALLVCFARHTSCSLVIQENADPDVKRDLDEFFARLVPDADDTSMGWLRHVTEGPDDMPAHIKAALTASSLSVPVADGRMLLGTWQGLYLFEHRTGAQSREIVLHLAQ